MPTIDDMKATWVKAAKLDSSQPLQVDYFDSKIPGFGLRISQEGRKSWFVMYRHGGRKRRLTLGTYPSLSLADARDKARSVIHAVDGGHDPAAQKKADRLAETFAELASAYLEKHSKIHKRSWKEDERLIKRELLPEWRTIKAKDITRRDVIEMLDKVLERGAPIQANRLLALIRKIYNWAIGRDIVNFNPCTQVKAPGKEQQRQRVLNTDEIIKIWNAFDNQDVIIGSMFKLRLLTAQRGGEIESMRWEDLDLSAGWWTIPADKAKNGLTHRVPLSQFALHLLDVLSEHRQNDNPWVFPSPSRKGQHIANVNKAAQRVRSESGVKFVLHDLRRTAASNMTSNGISRLVVSKILNHIEPGVTKVYDRHGYDEEKQIALDRWANILDTTISTNQDQDKSHDQNHDHDITQNNIIPFPARG